VFEGMVNFMMMSQKVVRKTGESTSKEQMVRIPICNSRA